MSKPSIVIICGPTASGKSKIALKIASANNGEIINADSTQIYKEIPILSCSPGQEDKKQIPHHLYNHKSLDDEYSVGIYLSEALPIIKKVTSRGKLPIIVGGTGLYIKALLEGISKIAETPKKIREDIRNLFNKLGNEKFFEELKKLDPKATAKLHPNNSQRLIRAMEVFKNTGKSLYDFHQDKSDSPLDEYNVKLFIIKSDREKLYKKCTERFAQLLETGAIEEVKKIADKFPATNVKAIGYSEIYKYIQGEISKEEAIGIASQKTRNYAKRQITFFKHQIDGEEIDEKADKLYFPQ